MSGALCVMLSGTAMTVEASPASVGGTGVGTITTTQAMSAVVTGAVGALTYAWSVLGDGGIFALSPGTASTYFRMNGAVADESYYANATVTVADGAGQTATASGQVNFVGSA